MREACTSASDTPFSLAHIEVLRFVHENKNPTMRDLADYLHVTAPSTSALVDELVGKGYFLRHEDKPTADWCAYRFLRKERVFLPRFCSCGTRHFAVFLRGFRQPTAVSLLTVFRYYLKNNMAKNITLTEVLKHKTMLIAIGVVVLIAAASITYYLIESKVPALVALPTSAAGAGDITRPASWSLCYRPFLRDGRPHCCRQCRRRRQGICGRDARILRCRRARGRARRGGGERGGAASQARFLEGSAATDRHRYQAICSLLGEAGGGRELCGAATLFFRRAGEGGFRGANDCRRSFVQS